MHTQFPREYVFFLMRIPVGKIISVSSRVKATTFLSRQDPTQNNAISPRLDLYDSPLLYIVCFKREGRRGRISLEARCFTEVPSTCLKRKMQSQVPTSVGRRKDWLSWRLELFREQKSTKHLVKTSQDGKYQGMIVRQGSVDVQVAHGFSLTSILLESRKGNLLSDRVFFMTLQHES